MCKYAILCSSCIADIIGEDGCQEEPPPPGLEQEKDEKMQSPTENQHEEAQPDERREVEDGSAVENGGDAMEVESLFDKTV